MDLWLAPDVHALALGEDIVFLDAVSDAYLCLVGARDAIGLREGRRVVTGPAEVEMLREAGLVDSRQTPPGRAIPPKPTLDLPAAGRPFAARDVVAATLAGAATVMDFRRWSFRQLLAHAGRRREGASDEAAVLEAAAVFRRLRPWSPVGGACLMRSYYLLRHLRLLGLDAEWVIGVRTWPFMAHCWLQAGDVALDDDVERLVAYTPILAV